MQYYEKYIKSSSEIAELKNVKNASSLSLKASNSRNKKVISTEIKILF